MSNKECTCSEDYNCCDCASLEYPCGCRYCFTCNCCDECKKEKEEEKK